MAKENAPSADFSAIIKELEKVSKEWLKIAKTQSEAATSLDKVLGKFDAMGKSLGGVTKELTSAVAKLETLIATQQRLATQTAATTEVIRRQKSTLATPVTTPVEKISGIVQKGTTRETIQGTGANLKEIIAYKDAIGRLKEILGRKNVTELQASKIFGELQKGETVAYTGILRKVRNAMDDVLIAKSKLGAAQKKEMEQLRESAVAEDRERTRIKQTTEALKAQEAQRKANAAAMSKSVAATGTLLQQQPILTKTPADRALGTTDRTMRVVQATMPEMLNYKNAIARVKELQAQHDITYGRIRQIWTDLGQNKVKAYTGGLGDVQNALYKVRTAHEQLGASFRKQADEEAAAYVQSHVSRQRATTSLQALKEKVNELTVSWKSFSRLLAVQIFHQAVSSLVRTMAEGMQTVVELGVRIGEVRTISQDAQLSNKEWRQGFRELSDAFGTPMLDQVAAGYEAISDQIVKGADTFKYLAEVNKFAATTASTTLEAHQLLGSTINAFGLDLSRVQQIAASFFSTIDLGRVRAREMAESFGQIAVPAHQFGVTLNELQSLITVGTRQGIRYNTTATYLRNMFLKLQKPTEEMSKYFREIGVSSGQAAIATYGFIPFLTMLSEKFDDNSEEIAKLMGNIRAMQGGMITTGANLQAVKNDFEEIRTAVEKYNKATAIMLEETPEKKIQMLSESLKNFFTVDITATMVEMVASIGFSIDQVKAMAIGAATAITALIITAIGAVAATLLANPITAGFAGFFLVAGSFAAEYLIQASKAAEVDAAVAKNKIAWEQKKFDAVNANYDKERALFDEAVQYQLQTLAGLKSILVYDINALKAPYENFIQSTGRLEEKIIDGIRDQISETSSEITRLSSIATKKQKEFNEEMKVYDLIMARRLTGKDTPSRQEPTTERKFEATAASMKMLEEELVRASTSMNDKRFEAIAAKMESTMKEVVDLSDKYAEEKGLGSRQLIASGEAYFRYWFGRVEEQRRAMQNNAAAEIGQYKTKEEFLQDEITRVRDLAKIVKETSWTDIGKLKDPDEFNRVMKEQANASQRLQEYGKKYGVEFYKKVQLALESARVEELIILKNQEFQVDAQSQIAQKVKKRQDDEFERNRLIAIEYLKGYMNANKEIREINEIIYGAKATMSLGGKDLKTPEMTPDERVKRMMETESQNRLYDLTKKRQDGEKEGDRVKWQDYETKGKEAIQSVEEVYNQITVGAETPKTALMAVDKTDAAIRQRIEQERIDNEETWRRYRELGIEANRTIGNIQQQSRAVSMPVIGPSLESYGRSFRYASGKSAGIDTQPAWLSPQEMVMNPAASRRFYSTLVALNSNQRRFGSGSSGGTSYSVGDVIINGSMSNADTNIIRMGKQMRKQIRLGRLNLGP